jgi:hypothetical protein
VRQFGEQLEASPGERVDDRRRCPCRTAAVLAGRDRDRDPDLGQTIECVGDDAVLEHEGLHLGRALELDRALAVGGVARAQPMVHVGAQRRGVERVEWWFGGEVGVGRVAVGERWTAAPGGSGDRVGRWHAVPPAHDDGLVQPEPGKRTGPAHLGHQQGGTAHRVADRLQVGGRQVVDDSEHVVHHAAPGEVHGGRQGAVAVATEVDGPAVGHAGQVPGQRCPHHPVESRGMAEQQRRALAAEVDERERDAVGRGHLLDRGHTAMLAVARAGDPTGARGSRR